MGKEDLKTLIEGKKLFPIIPLQNYDNKPYVKWSLEENRIKSISEFESISNKKYTGFSLLTGKISGIMVIDIDKNHGDGSIDGQKSFDELINDLSEEDKEQISNTFSVRSPNGGIHLYFKYRRGLKSKAEYTPGVDIRTDGGLIVLPYTKRKLDDGNIKEYKVLNDADIKEMPKALFDKLIKLDKRQNPSNDLATPSIDLVSTNYKEGARNDKLFRDAIGIISKSRIRDIETVTAIVQGLNLYKCSPPITDITEISNIVGSIVQRLHPSYCNEKGNIINYQLAQYILDKQPSYTKGNLWFMYDNEKGVYRYLEFKEVQRMFFDYTINDVDKTSTRSKSFSELLMLLSEDAREVHDEKKYINCLNGVIDIESNEPLEHDPKYKTEIQFQANLILDSKEYEELFNKSEFKKFLGNILDNESIKTLQEAWGLMLSPHAREVQNCFIYKGEGSNGKSVTFDIQEALIDDNKHICSIGLGDFGGDFTVSVAEGKHANIVRDDELSGKTVNKAFKSMVCGEPILVNRKGKDLVRLSFNITHFFGLNRLPSASDKSTGFFRRPIIIPFNSSFGTEKEVVEGKRDKLKDTQIGQRIIDNELDIVFTWAYYGLLRVKANKWQVTISKAAEEEMEEYREEVDSAYAFFKERITVANKKEAKVAKKDVYKTYYAWCISNNRAPMNPTHLGRQLSSFGVKHIKSNSIGYYLNIEVNDLELLVGGDSPFNY